MEPQGDFSGSQGTLEGLTDVSVYLREYLEDSRGLKLRFRRSLDRLRRSQRVSRAFQGFPGNLR